MNTNPLFREVATGGRWRPVEVVEGDRRGELTAARLIDNSHLGRRWEWICDCGISVFRLAASVNASVRRGATPSCGACRREYGSGLTKERLEARRDKWRAMWQAGRGLWTEGSASYYQARIAEDLRQKGHAAPVDTDGAGQAVAAGFWDPVASRHPAVQQRMASLYPLRAKRGRIFGCVDCSAARERAFGCVECLEPVCIECVRAERHVHDSSEGRSLLSVGKALGVSQERARQIEQGALRKLHLAWTHSANMESFAPAMRAFQSKGAADE